MSNQVDLSRGLELGGSPGPAGAPNSERKSLEQICQELIEERDRLRAEVAQLRAERDQYLKSLYALLPSQFTFDERELADLEQNGLTLEQILEDLRTPQGT